MTTSGTIRTLLTDTLRCPDLLASAARDSHAHPLGFDKIVLHSAPDGSKTRIHLWKTGAGAHEHETPHNHAWSLHSLVLHGQIHNSLFRETDRDDTDDPRATTTYKKYRMDTSVDDGAYHVTLEAPAVRLLRKRTDVYYPGDAYILHHSQVHSTCVFAPETITFVQQSPPETNGNILYKHNPNGAADPNEHFRCFDPETLRDAINHVLHTVDDRLLDRPVGIADALK